MIANLALIFVSRSRSESLGAIFARKNAVYWWISTLACLALIAVIYVPSIAAVFRFTPPPWPGVATVAVSAVVLVLLAGRWLRQESPIANS